MNAPAPAPAPTPTTTPEPPHPRDATCVNAGTELTDFLREWVKRHDLTAVELLHMLALHMRIQIQHMGIAERAAMDQMKTAVGGK